MKRRRRDDADAAARARLVEHARRTILGDLPDDDPYLAAYQSLAQGASAFLDASTPPPAPRRPRARTALRVTAFIASSSLVGVSVVALATQTNALQWTGFTRTQATDEAIPSSSASATPLPVALPHLDRPSLPRRLPVTSVSAIVDQVIEALAQQHADEAAAQQALAEQPDSGTSSGGTSSGGTSSGGTSSGGGTQPPPAPAPAYVDQLGFSASSGSAAINVSASVHTTGSMNVTVQCTAAGTTISLTGPSPLNGGGSYTGSFTGLAPGSYDISCAVPGQLTSNTKSITVYE